MSSTGNSRQQGSFSAMSPIPEDLLKLLQQSSHELSPQQLAWVSGYFWGVSQSAPNSFISDAPAATPQPSSVSHSATTATLTILYISQTGNAKGVAEALFKRAQQQGITALLFDASEYKVRQLMKESHLIIVASTNGEGEVPDNGVELYDYLQSKKVPKLDKLSYGIIALGDSTYEQFCQTGKDFDRLLAQQGAQPFLHRVDCDVDYEQDVNEWQKQALHVLDQQLTQPNDGQVVQLPVHAKPATRTYDKQQPYLATLLTNQKITGRDSSKDVRHIEIDLGESQLTYQPGDALGVWFENSTELTKAVLKHVGLSGIESVTVDEQSVSIYQALLHHYEITASNPQFITQYAALANHAELNALVEDKARLRAFSQTTQTIDVITRYPCRLSVLQLTSLLRRLTPRLYSIASSQTEVENEVHLTVGVVEYEQNDDVRYGGASGFLAHRLEEGGRVKVFIEPNHHFKLPDDDTKPIIMIGPGTGIAPFRAFMQEREARQASGENWLIFGDRSFTQDFLYQTEWQKQLKSGVLSRLDVAFSRDQSAKIYVQHKLLENASQVWQWLNDGAHLYVCGDASRMAKDVHTTLLTIIEQQGNKTKEQAELFLTDLRKAKRYQKDVY